MTNQSYAQGTVTVTTTPTLVCTISTENDGAILQTGSTAVFIGGPTVTTTGATAGIQLAPNTMMTVPSVGGATHDVYAVTATGTATIAYLYPW